MNEGDKAAQRRQDAMTEAIAARNNAAAWRDLAEARKSVTRLRRDAVAHGGLLGFLVALSLWPFLHMRRNE